LLASHNDISHLALAEETLMQPVLPDKWEFFRNPEMLIGRIEDIHAAPILSRLMKAPDPQVRRGAAQCLRQMKTDDSVEALVGGLNDPDWEVRWVSVMGLAEIVGTKDGERWHPYYETFKAEEKKYLDHWNAWAASRPLPAEAK
jgi:HEAT repeat protein